MNIFSVGSVKDLWAVFLLFAIPVGGGIPAGVLLAQNLSIGWFVMGFIYLISDIVLAILFEPIMHLFVFASKRFKFLAKFGEALKKSTSQTIAGYGAKPGPFLLVTIAFGVDPMTGRAAALAAGHGFISGWAIAIMGDMIFFTLIAVSTICLNNILGDGTWTAIIIMALMMLVPPVVRRFKKIKLNF